MHSKALNQAVRLALDIAGEKREPISRRELAESIWSQHRDLLFAEADQRDMAIKYIITGIVKVQREPLSDDELKRIHLPRKFYPLLAKIPQWICVGNGHVKSIYATAEQWGINASLKIGIGEDIIALGNVSQDICNALQAQGANDLTEIGRIAA